MQIIIYLICAIALLFVGFSCVYWDDIPWWITKKLDSRGDYYAKCVMYYTYFWSSYLFAIIGLAVIATYLVNRGSKDWDSSK